MIKKEPKSKSLLISYLIAHIFGILDFIWIVGNRRKGLEGIEALTIVTFCTITCAVILYFKLYYSDPGSCNENDGMSSTFGKGKCFYCGVFMSIRSRHCKDCHVCVDKFDHHCHFLDNCIGRKNHFMFMMYVAIEFLGLLLVSALFCMLAMTFDMQENSSGFEISLTGIILLQVICVPFCLICGGLFVFHLFLVSTNQTSWEYLRGHGIGKYRDDREENYDSDGSFIIDHRSHHLDLVPEGIFVFDDGIFNNCKYFCFSNDSVRELENRQFFEWQQNGAGKSEHFCIQCF